MKVPFTIETGTYINRERPMYHDNNDPFEDVDRTLVRLLANGIVVEERKDHHGDSTERDTKILSSLAHDVLNSSSIKETRRCGDKKVATAKKLFNKIIKDLEKETAERERFATDRLKKLKTGKLKKWKHFEWENSNVVDDLIGVMEKHLG